MQSKDTNGGGIVEEKRYYDTAEAATYLGLPSKSVYRAVYNGLLTREMHGGSQRFTQEALDAYKSSNQRFTQEALDAYKNNKEEHKEDTPVQSTPTLPASNGQHAAELLEEHPGEAMCEQPPEMAAAIRYLQRLVEAATQEKERSRKLLATLTSVRAFIDAAIAEYEQGGE